MEPNSELRIMDPFGKLGGLRQAVAQNVSNVSVELPKEQRYGSDLANYLATAPINPTEVMVC